MVVLTQEKMMNIDYAAAAKARPKNIYVPKSGDDARANSDAYEKQMHASVKKISD